MPGSQTYSKPALTVGDQVALLERRGLIVADRLAAMAFLQRVNYYRFSAYTYVYEVQVLGGPRQHVFQPNTTFEAVRTLYDFDAKLRSLTLQGIEMAEVDFKTAFCRVMALQHGSHWYENPALFRDTLKHANFLKDFDDDIAKRANSEACIQHYINTYATPQRVPAWMMIDVVSLGTISHLYANLRSASDAKAIAREFGLQSVIMQSWMRALTDLRNFCAHNSRIWNREFPCAVKVPHQAPTYFVPGNRYYHYAQVIRYLLEQRDVHRPWCKDLANLLCARTEQQSKAMGFQWPLAGNRLWP